MVLISNIGVPYNIRTFKLVVLIIVVPLILLYIYNGSQSYKEGILSKVRNGTDTDGPTNKKILLEILNITQITYKKVKRLDKKVQSINRKLIIVDKHNQTNKQTSLPVTRTNFKSKTVTASPIIDKYFKKNNKCYADRDFDKKEGLFKLSDIQLAKRKPIKDKTIFFHETSCSKNGKLRLNARQACSIESAALLNPKSEIFVLFASPVARSYRFEPGNNLDIIGALSNYKNIYYRNVNLWRYTRGTPIQDWFDEGHLLKSRYIQQHLSDFLRYLTLWHWGGTHLDLDIILMQSLENITTNFVGLQDKFLINGAVISLSYKDIGHAIASLLLKYVKTHFNKNQLTGIGPYLVTDVFKNICKTDKIELMTPARCSGIKIFYQKFFYAIEYYYWDHFFEEYYLDEVMNLTNESIAIHLWNELSKDRTVKAESEVAYIIYADKYCPKVYSSCGESF